MTKGIKKMTIFDVILILIFAFVIVITIYPFLNVLAISFNNSMDTVKGGIYILPRKFTLANYQEIFKSSSKLPHAFVISVLRTVIGTVLGVISTAMLAFTISRTDYVFRKPVTVIFVLTMYVSGGLIPSYMLIRDLHLINKFAVYIIPGLISAYNVIVIRSFIDGLPYALQESAKIDGANDLTIFFKIVLPLCVPVIATISLFIAVGQWNSWYDTYLYAREKQSLSTLQYELMKVLQNSQQSSFVDNNTAAQLAKQNTVNPESIKMAITIVATVPILLVYPFVQKYFVTGMTLGAVKS
ncbi:carbohydrate ABC transporter permease [Clostridium oryzae]|uniref:L-arabinose transport system permease protein AraQ n=1 Tax=Clostridium oryzae TaxID=1450648 RepID=A0A1V4IZB5_9CLOT|nr:carbohydrate ABC transporter permease [Clostridium oryzae]OPJ65124.1 L-arabinose transport system permease protein AraQ [Clostridium oryzae]